MKISNCTFWECFFIHCFQVGFKFLLRKENQRIQRILLGGRQRTNNKLTVIHMARATSETRGFTTASGKEIKDLITLVNAYVLMDRSMAGQPNKDLEEIWCL